MPDFKQTFQEEVRRLARKELKSFEAKINEQKKTISALQKRLSELEKKQAAAPAQPAADKTPAAAPAADGRKARFSPKSLTKFRKKYSLSQKALAALLGVTPFTVSHWELGKNRPRTVQIEAFSALSKLGKRNLYALVAEKAPDELPAPKKAASKKAAAKNTATKKAAPKKAAPKKTAKNSAPAAPVAPIAPAEPAKPAKKSAAPAKRNSKKGSAKPAAPAKEKKA